MSTASDIAALILQHGQQQGDTLQNLAAIAAHGQLGQADIWSKFTSNLASLADPARMLAEVNQAKTQKLQQQALSLGVQEKQQQLAANQKALADQDTLRQAAMIGQGLPASPMAAGAGNAITAAVGQVSTPAPLPTSAGMAGPTGVEAPQAPPAPKLTEADYQARNEQALKKTTDYLTSIGRPDLADEATKSWTATATAAAGLREKMAAAGKAQQEEHQATAETMGAYGSELAKLLRAGTPPQQAVQLVAHHADLNGLDPTPVLQLLNGKTPAQMLQVADSLASVKGQRDLAATESNAASEASKAGSAAIDAGVAREKQNNEAGGQIANAQKAVNEAAISNQVAAGTRGGLTPEQQWQQKLQTDQLRQTQARTALDERIQNFKENEGSTNTAYNVNKTRLDAVRKPVDDASGKIAELTDLVNQHTPQGDALIAPKLLTVLVGGAGTGIRINGAEINRVTGGNTATEALKQALNKFSTDPAHAQITDAQRGQIRALISTVADKATMNTKLIQEADANLLDAKSPDEQRRIVAKLQADTENVNAGKPYTGEIRTNGTETRQWDGAKWNLVK